MEKVKVVIYVEGGNVQAVYGRDVDVQVIDFDNLKAEGFGPAARENILVEARGDLPQQY